MPQSGPERLRQALLQVVAVARLLGEQPEYRELQHVLHDISNRYIDASTVRSELTSRAGGPGRPGPVHRRRRGAVRMRAGTHLHFPAMQSVTDYALARRAVLRDFRRGTLTRLDVCDAHPELLRAAQFIGTDIDDECPVCGATNLRLVILRLRREAEAGERPGDQQPGRAAQAGRVVRRVRLLRRRGLRRLPLEPPPPPVAPRPPARELTDRSAASGRRSSVVDELAGVLRDARDAPQLGLGDDGLASRACPTTAGRRRRAGRGRARRRGSPQFSQTRSVTGAFSPLAARWWNRAVAVGTLVALPGAERALDGGGGGDDRKPRRGRVTAPAVAARKGDGTPLVMVTAYDAPSARTVDAPAPT